MAPETEIQSSLNFDGPTFVPGFDAERLKGQMRRVFDLMKDGQWRTLREISSFHDCHDSEAAISARLRDLRKIRFGGFMVDRRRRGDPGSGLFEYRVTKGEK